MKKITFLLLITIVTLTGCKHLELTTDDIVKGETTKKKTIQIDEVDNDLTFEDSQRKNDEIQTFNFENILTKHLYKSHYSKWRLVEENGQIEKYEIERGDNDNDETPSKTLFFRNDQYCIMNDEIHNLRTGGLSGSWEIITDKNILKIFLDSGKLLQYKILSLDNTNLEIEKIDTQEIHGVNAFPKKEGDEPKWEEFTNEKITFKYPKTFCGTDWQEDWDNNSCDKDWIVNETNNQILVQPSYSSFGYEFGGDIIISFLDTNEFYKIVENAKEESVESPYKIYSKKNINGYPDKIDEYYIEKGDNYIKIINNFPNRYRKYIKFLLESIK